MWFRLISTAFVTFFSILNASMEEKCYSTLGVETFILDNGMKVAFKQTDNDPNEVVVRLMAKGGFAELSKKEKAAGQISAQAAFRSGISDLGFDKMHSMLYTHSIEFDIQMQPFSRSLELSASSEELDQLFKIVNLFFTKSRFSNKAYRAHKEVLLKGRKYRENDTSRQLEEAYMNLNTQHFHPFNILKPKDIESACFESSKRFFIRSFVEPSDFICIIVGDFDTSKMKKIVSEYLAVIPKKEEISSPKIPPLPDFPKGIRSKVIKSYQQNQTVTRMTFPLQISVTQDNFRNLKEINFLIQERLIKTICRSISPRPEIRVSLDFPYYPTFHNPWITIQYISEPKLANKIGQSILTELKRMQFLGVDTSEMEFVRDATKSNNDLLKMDNDYWLTQIANYLIWDWDLDSINKSEPNSSVEEIQQQLFKAITLENYTIISLQPKSI